MRVGVVDWSLPRANAAGQTAFERTDFAQNRTPVREGQPKRIWGGPGEVAGLGVKLWPRLS